jgi:hypothetical protein
MRLRFYLVAGSMLAILSCSSYVSKAQATGFMEGHLRILPHREVNLADDGGVTEPVAEDYAAYPLLILAAESGKEIARVTADEKGNYRIGLPPGNYILDVGRAPKHLRARPRPFTVELNQTVRVDLDIDPGVR